MPHKRMMRNHRHAEPRRRRQGRSMQSAGGVSHRDLVVQKKKFLLFTQNFFENSTGAFSFGYANINVSTTAAGVANTVWDDILSNAALNFEEYRISRVIVRAQPGTGFSNDDRIKTSLFARVDTNAQPVGATVGNLNSLISAESTVNRTFTERSNVILADFAPICFAPGSTSRTILYSKDQWYDIEDRASQLWRGATVAPVIPEVLSPNEKALTIWTEVYVDFRTRRNAPGTFALSAPQPRPVSPSLPSLNTFSYKIPEAGSSDESEESKLQQGEGGQLPS